MRFVPVIFRFLLPEQSSAADEVAEAEDEAEKERQEKTFNPRKIENHRNDWNDVSAIGAVNQTLPHSRKGSRNVA